MGKGKPRHADTILTVRTPGHRWQYVGTSASGNYGRSECTTCDAAVRRASISNYRAFIAEEVTA